MDNYRISIGKIGSMKGYKSMSSREFDFADFGSGDGIQVSRECDKAYEKELKRRISVILDSFASLDELKEQYNFLNPPQSLERNISTLNDNCLKEINSCMEISHFENVEELEKTFHHIFSNMPSHIKDYINAAQILETKGINIRNL
jgi:hypothetical protein